MLPSSRTSFPKTLTACAPPPRNSTSRNSRSARLGARTCWTCRIARSPISRRLPTGTAAGSSASRHRSTNACCRMAGRWTSGSSTTHSKLRSRSTTRLACCSERSLSPSVSRLRSCACSASGAPWTPGATSNGSSKCSAKAERRRGRQAFCWGWRTSTPAISERARRSDGQRGGWIRRRTELSGIRPTPWWPGNGPCPTASTAFRRTASATFTPRTA